MPVLNVHPHLVHFVLQFRQTACFHNFALTPSPNSNNPLRMKLVDSFQKLIECVVCVTDNQDWAMLRAVTKDSISVPFLFVMQQYIGNLKDKSSSFIVFDNMIMSNAIKAGVFSNAE